MVVFLHAYNLDTKQHGQILVLDKSFNWFIQKFISFGITRIAVPLFFLISGYLFFLNFNGSFLEFKNKVQKRFRTLALPFLFWSFFGVFIYFVLQSIPKLKPFFSKELVVNYTFIDWMKVLLVNPIPYQLWFIRDLFLLVLVTPVLFFILKRIPKTMIMVLFFGWFFNFNEFNNSFEALLFFSCGGFVSVNKVELINKSYPEKKYLFLFSWVLLLLLKIALEYFDCNEIGIRIILKSSIIVGIIAFWIGYDGLLESQNSLKLKLLKISSYSFFIYASHEPILTIIKKTLFIVAPKTNSGYFAVYFFAPLMTLVICVLFGVILKIKLNYLYNFITGNR